jgi:predicted enzyme related to lactoylglutathione lyase
MQEALAKAEEDARAVADRAIVQASPDLAEQIKRRREIEQKLRETRGESARTRLGALAAEPPSPPPSAPAEQPPTPKLEAAGTGSIVHFDIPVDDVERARKFYGELLGWKIEKVPGPMEYWLITPKDEKAVRGGMMRREQPQQTITDYFIVPSVDEYVGKVQKLGGQVVVPKMPVPGMGYFAYCLDTEKNAFAIWETNPEAK